jgi:hypothetical protein
MNCSVASATSHWETDLCISSASRPPESGGQRDETKSTSRERAFPSRIAVVFSKGTSPRATPSGRAALLTQEGVARSRVGLVQRSPWERTHPRGFEFNIDSPSSSPASLDAPPSPRGEGRARK